MYHSVVSVDSSVAIGAQRGSLPSATIDLLQIPLKGHQTVLGVSRSQQPRAREPCNSVCAFMTVKYKVHFPFSPNAG